MSLWKLIYHEWKPEEQGKREALLTLGNGYFATRGAVEESSADEINYPGTYLAGGFNRLKSEVKGKIIENEDLVNWPNWLYLSFKIKDGEWFDLEKVEIKDFYQELDLQNGLLIRKVTFEDANGNITNLTSTRFAGMNDEHLAGIQWILEPVNWSETIEVRSGLDGNVVNNNVARYRKLSKKHLDLIDKGVTEEGIYLKVQTNQSNVQMAQAARTCFYQGNEVMNNHFDLVENGSFIAQKFKVSCIQGKAIVIEKVVALYTSRDWAISEVSLEAKKAIQKAGRFDQLIVHHKETWKKIWNRCDIEIEGDPDAQMVLRFHIFHLLQTASFNTTDFDAGIPARGLHGEGYRGHVFWDDLFIFPYLNLRLPELTRELLMYRYRRLREANYIAQEMGCRGACFPWQSGSNGREETSKFLYNTLAGKWKDDNTFLQRHINAAIVYNIWQYYQSSADREFMIYHGARIMLEISLFFSSIATYNDKLKRFEIKGVVGPDEYHTQYPGQNDIGLNNNAYTNIMVSWLFQRAEDVLQILTSSHRKELLDFLEIDQQDLDRWKEISHKIHVPFISKTVISQFDGYENLKELDWSSYRDKFGENLRLDLILHSEGDSIENYKVSKQADVLMLFYVFSYKELEQLFTHMGYDFPKGLIPDNIKYYEERTSHGSTLSRLVNSWIMARLDRQKSWKYFKEALQSDISDIQGGTTQEGVHLGAMAGTVDLVQRGYTGIEIRDNVLWFNPSLPDHVNKIKMRLSYRGHWFNLFINKEKMEIDFEETYKGEVKIGFKERIFSSKDEQSLRFDL